MSKKSLVKLLLPLEECTRKDAGTKGYNLKLLSKVEGVVIPETLCVPAKYFDEINALNTSDSRTALSKFRLPDWFSSTFIEQVQSMFGNQGLVIRSSATCEDTPFLSFAGNYSSFLNIKGKRQILRAIKLCYLSMFNENADVYAEQGGVDLAKHRMAILIQPVAPVKKAGVMFTTNPVTLDKKEVVIEFVNGLGDKMVDGSMRPETLFIPIKSRRNVKDIKYKSLAQLGKKIEKAFDEPQDIEWGILEDNSTIFFQSRPITVTTSSPMSIKKMDDSKKLRAKGMGASIGTATGVVHSVQNGANLRNLGEDTILFYKGKVDLHFLQHLPKIKGMIMRGGILSHVAVIARELGIPLVAGVSDDLTNLNGTTVSIDGKNGLIYEA